MIPEAEYILRVSGRKDDGEQSEINATQYSWTIDSLPPQVQLYNTPLSLTLNKKANITVAGQDVVKYKYKTDIIVDGQPMNGSWSSPLDIIQPIRMDTSALTYNKAIVTLSVMGIDKAGNSSPAPVVYSWIIEPQNSALTEIILADLPPFFSKNRNANIQTQLPGNKTYALVSEYQLDDETAIPITRITVLLLTA